jgi:hypothetical protein
MFKLGATIHHTYAALQELFAGAMPEIRRAGTHRAAQQYLYEI